MECPPEKTSGIPRIVYRHQKVTPTLVRGEPKTRRFADTFARPLFAIAGERGYRDAPRGERKCGPRGEVLPKMSENSPETTEKLEEVNEAVQELRGKRSQFYNPQSEQWVKRDKDTGQIMESDEEPYKAVNREQ